ncbi:4746_t:CDS:2 [Ambispora leptoticha]|uniref:4746_t:CDS:1 n=1 Tax=Ambispora leptoticha TaxID=144679 RepID=A0A9N9A4S6_9GLOM|nr:4746_t:CDS:2 [Ambispora leptoticha]
MVTINTLGTANDEYAAVSSSESDRRPRVAVIGAGSSGLTAMKQCIDDDLEPVCFEQNPHVGGLWKYEEIDEKNKDPYSSLFKSIIINTSKETMTFSDYPIPHDWPTYLPHHQVLRYFEMYAERFNLYQYIKFRTSVLHVSNLPDDRWKVKYMTEGEEEKEEIFDYVMVCSGHHRKHRWPKYEGMDQFGGRQIHSHFYRNTKGFEDKRVVVVGCGNSGMDISVELSTVASQEQLSKITLGSYPPGLKPKHPANAHHPTIKSDFFERLSTGTIIVKQNIVKLNQDKSVEFVDGTRIEDIDVIVYCTGYDISFPFLDGDLLTGEQDLEKFDPEYRENLAWLYKMVFPPRYKNIAFLGLVQVLGPIFPVAEMQARYATSIIGGHITLPSTEVMDQWIENYQNFLQTTFYSSARHTIETPFLWMMDHLAKEIGCLPTGKEVFLKYGFKAWKNYFFGMVTPIQYRLFGRHSYDKAIEWINIYNGGQPSTFDNNGVALEDDNKTRQTGKKEHNKKDD